MGETPILRTGASRSPCLGLVSLSPPSHAGYRHGPELWAGTTAGSNPGVTPRCPVIGRPLATRLGHNTQRQHPPGPSSDPQDCHRVDPTAHTSHCPAVHALLSFTPTKSSAQDCAGDTLLGRPRAHACAAGARRRRTAPGTPVQAGTLQPLTPSQPGQALPGHHTVTKGQS